MIDVAFVVRQVNCTWSPAEITVGVAVNCAVGAAGAAAGAVSSGGGASGFLWHPETATTARSAKAEIEKRFRGFK